MVNEKKHLAMRIHGVRERRMGWSTLLSVGEISALDTLALPRHASVRTDEPQSLIVRQTRDSRILTLVYHNILCSDSDTPSQLMVSAIIPAGYHTLCDADMLFDIMLNFGDRFEDSCVEFLPNGAKRFLNTTPDPAPYIEEVELFGMIAPDSETGHKKHLVMDPAGPTGYLNLDINNGAKLLDCTSYPEFAPFREIEAALGCTTSPALKNLPLPQGPIEFAPNPEAKPEPAAQPMPVQQPEPKPEPQPKPQPKPEPVPQPEPKPKPQPKPQLNTEPKPKPAQRPAPMPNPEPRPAGQPEPTPSAGNAGAEEKQPWFWRHRTAFKRVMLTVAILSIADTLLLYCFYGPLTPNGNRYYHSFSPMTINWGLTILSVIAMLILVVPALRLERSKTSQRFRFGIFPSSGVMTSIISALLTTLYLGSSLLFAAGLTLSTLLYMSPGHVMADDLESAMLTMAYMGCAALWGVIDLIYLICYRKL